MSQIREFPEVDLQQWAERVKKELKPPHTFESLQWQVSEFFSLDPIYDETVFEKENLAYLQSFHKRWAENKNKERPDILAFADPFQKESQQNFTTAETYHFQSWVAGSKINQQATLQISIRNPFAESSSLNESSEADPLMDSLLTGKWKAFTSKDLEKSTIHIHASDVHNAGGSAVQEIATALLASEHYRQSLEGNSTWTNSAVIHLGIGPLFWLELAKIRAMRLVYINFCEVNSLQVKVGNIRTETSKLYWSKTDSELNLLRHSSEVMSSILGGADQILVYPHTFEQEKTLDANRLAVNIPLLAFEESNLHSHFDPASGAFILEMLTHKLAEAAWKLFADWNETGYEKMVKENKLQSAIQKNAEILKTKFANKEVQMVGVNVYTSPMAKTSPQFPVHTPIENPEFQPLAPVFLDV
jgi:methylmalonyl-CoA mutase